MAPQLEFEEGTSFYGAVEIAPKVEERKTSRSKTLKFLVGVAFIAVAVTAAVFAFTSPVSNNKSVSVIDPEQNSCTCVGTCVDIEGYHKEGECSIVEQNGECVDVHGDSPRTCSQTVVDALGVDATSLCAACQTIQGSNPCDNSPCQNGGQCYDRVKNSDADINDPARLGYECYCPYGFTGPNCAESIDFCSLSTDQLMFCDNGQMDHECQTDEDCTFVFEVDADVGSKCTVAGIKVCDEHAKCTDVPDLQQYLCKCETGYAGDGYATDQSKVAYGSALKSTCPKTTKTNDEEVTSGADLIREWGWVDRGCTEGTDEYKMAGCSYINGCTQDGAIAVGLDWYNDLSGVCHNGAICNDNYAAEGKIFATTCTCPTSSRGGVEFELWKGEYCGEDVNECEKDPTICGRIGIGKCENLMASDAGERAKSGFDCSCETGWIPQNPGWEDGEFLGCVDYEDCQSIPCLNGGTCADYIDGSGEYECTCTSGWTGDNCEININECIVDDVSTGRGKEDCEALDNMHCVDTNMDGSNGQTGNEKGYYCACNEYWEWKDTKENKFSYHAVDNVCVDIDDCSEENNACNEGATCINQKQSVMHDWVCECPFGWEGSNCEIDINECEFVKTMDASGTAQDIVHNCLEKNALCVNTDGSWDCECNQGWYGDGVHFCRDIDDCKRLQKIPLFCASDMVPCKAGDECGGKCVHTLDEKVKVYESYPCTENMECKTNVELLEIFPLWEGNWRCNGNSLCEHVEDEVTTPTLSRCTQTSDCQTDEQLLKVWEEGSPGSWECDMKYDQCTGDDGLTVDAYPKKVIEDENGGITYEYEKVTRFISPAPWIRTIIALDENDQDSVHQCGIYNAETKVFDMHGSCEDLGENIFICDCDDGWADSNCDLDVNECTADIHDCHKDATCKNMPGSFECECKDGYQDASAECRENDGKGEGCGRLCHDIDDCTTGPENTEYKCLHGQCRDVGVNAYRCKCTAGWEDFNCDADINECGLMTDTCDPTYGICTNTDGSYSCECKHGYFGSGLVGECTAIDDCANSPCEHGVCTDEGDFAYSCLCDLGWKDKKCDFDLNECVLEQGQGHNCHEMGRCVNTPGSFYCRCVSGYAGDGYTCTDLDDCDPDPCEPPEQMCRALGHAKPTGRYTCFENQPFQWENPIANLGCKDYGANQYKCEMCAGWDITTGADVNECMEGSMNQCAEFAICDNTEGSYDCSCQTGYYDPCICEEVEDGDPNTCRTCKTANGESCMPGRVCTKCTNCKAGQDTPSTKYSCEGDPALEGKWYFPRDPQFNGGKPTIPGRTTGRGFAIQEGSKCVHEDFVCVDVNECGFESRDAIVTYSGRGCASADKAECINECGTVTCNCLGLRTDCKTPDDCFWGDGETCNHCTVCGAHECEAFAPTSTTDRVCKPLIGDGKYAIETTAGHTAQCLVKWGEQQKVFPERYNWGGKVPTQNGGGTTGMDAADLCQDPICGVCDWNGRTAAENILAGGEAAWAFRHLEGENYLIMSAADGKGYRCLGFRAPGAPYPEMLQWITSIAYNADGQCSYGKCSSSDELCRLPIDCQGEDNECVFDKCSSSDTCALVGTCELNVLETCRVDGDCGDFGACLMDSGHCGGICSVSGFGCFNDDGCDGGDDVCQHTLCSNGNMCPGAPNRDGSMSDDHSCILSHAECDKDQSKTGMWTAEPSPLEVDDYSTYLCGMESVSMLLSNKMVVWNLKPLGQRSSTYTPNGCHSEKKCDEQLYDSLFVFRTQARGNGEYECLHFNDRDLSQYSHPTRVQKGTGDFQLSSTLCGINTVDGKSDEEMLIEQKNAVFKLIPLF